MDTFAPDGPTPAGDPLFLYFTSGTTAKAKLVEHTQISYPIGHLSTMYWLSLQPGDVHLNISSPGWREHAWSNVFAPWNAEATVLILNAARFSARRVARHAHPMRGDQLLRAAHGLADAHPGGPARVAAAAARAARAPASRSTPRSSTRCATPGGSPSATGTDRPRPRRRSATRRGNRSNPAPWAGRCRGTRSSLIDPVSESRGDQGEICIDLSRRAGRGLMVGYRDDSEQTAEVMRDGFYHTGDVGVPRRRGVHHLHRPVGRRLRVVRLPDLAVRARERAHRASGGGGGGRGRRPRTRCVSPCRRHSSPSAPDTRRQPSWRGRSSSIRRRISRGTSGCAVWSSPSCPRRSPGRSGVSICGQGARPARAAHPSDEPRTSSGRRISGSCVPKPGADAGRRRARASEIEAVHPLGDAAGLLRALPFDDEVDDELDASFPTSSTETSVAPVRILEADRDRRRETHLVQPVVDRRGADPRSAGSRSTSG